MPLRMLSLATGAVAIDADGLIVRKAGGQQRLDLFGADACALKIRAAALRAVAGNRALTVAVVTVQAAASLVPGVIGITAAAGGNPAAVVAEQGLGESAPIEKQHHLIAVAQMTLHQLQQLRRDPRLQRHLLDVDHLLACHTGTAGALAQTQHLVLAAEAIVQGLEGWGG